MPTERARCGNYHEYDGHGCILEPGHEGYCQAPAPAPATPAEPTLGDTAPCAKCDHPGFEHRSGWDECAACEPDGPCRPAPSPAASADVIERAREVVRLWDASSIPPQQQSDHVTFARALLDAVKEADRLRVSRAAIESSLRISEAARARLTGMCAQLWDALAEAAAREGNDGK